MTISEIVGRAPRWTKAAALGAFAAPLLLTTMYQIKPNEEGVVTRFGEYISTEGPGLHFKMPWPIESVDKVAVSDIRRLEIGFRTVEQGPPAQYEKRSIESHMLTGDENIVAAELIVQYKVKDSRDYLFNVKDPEGTMRDASEAALRQVIGDHGIDEAMTIGKTGIQNQTTAKLQEIVDGYHMGILITDTKLQDVDPHPHANQAFLDVVNAKENKGQIINEAYGYQNDVLPKARGGAERLLQEAQGYAAERVNTAKGDVARFNQMLAEYERAPEITADRLYLETMATIMPHVDMTIVDTHLGGPLQFLDIGKTEVRK